MDLSTVTPSTTSFLSRNCTYSVTGSVGSGCSTVTVSSWSRTRKESWFRHAKGGPAVGALTPALPPPSAESLEPPEAAPTCLLTKWLGIGESACVYVFWARNWKIRGKGVLVRLHLKIPNRSDILVLHLLGAASRPPCVHAHPRWLPRLSRPRARSRVRSRDSLGPVGSGPLAPFTGVFREMKSDAFHLSPLRCCLRPRAAGRTGETHHFIYNQPLSTVLAISPHTMNLERSCQNPFLAIVP